MNRPLASIDIGSNTFRLLIARPARNGSTPPWDTIYYTHRIVRLGEGLHHNGRLCDAGMHRAIQALREFAEILRTHAVAPKQTYAVATAAMREAENGQVFSSRIESETGIHIEIIDGDSEAAISLKGAVAVLLPQTRKNMLLFDIGGASTEFIRADDGQLIEAISRKLGVVRLVEAFLKSDPPTADDYLAMKEVAHEHLKKVELHWGNGHSPEHLVGTAGTVTTLTAIHLNLFPYDAARVNNHCITKTAFHGLRDRLLKLTHAEREAMPPIEPGRADLIIAGLAMIDAIMDRWRFDRLITVDAGLLEGVWLTGVENLS
ncbi:MAG: Ppx/GppA family phosphatase [Mariprofundaceae bacterium]